MWFSNSLKCFKKFITTSINVRYTSYNFCITKASMKLQSKFEYKRLSTTTLVSGIQFQMYIASMPRGIKIVTLEAK